MSIATEVDYSDNIHWYVLKQMPANFTSPAWTVLAQIAADPHWQGVFDGIALAAVEPLPFYYNLLTGWSSKLPARRIASC